MMDEDNQNEERAISNSTTEQLKQNPEVRLRPGGARGAAAREKLQNDSSRRPCLGAALSPAPGAKLGTCESERVQLGRELQSIARYNVSTCSRAVHVVTKAQLPLGLLTAAQGHPMLVELKNGETLNGHLVQCDNWMNLTLKEVVQTSPEGDRFFRLPEVYVRGNNTLSENSSRTNPQIAAAVAHNVVKAENGVGAVAVVEEDVAGEEVAARGSHLEWRGWKYTPLEVVLTAAAQMLQSIDNDDNASSRVNSLIPFSALNDAQSLAMPPRGLMVDGLWHCLCPSFNLSTFRNAAAVSTSLRGTRPLRAIKTASVRSQSAFTQRAYSTNLASDGSYTGSSNLESSGVPHTYESKQEEEQARERIQNEAPELKFKRISIRKPLRATFGVPKDLEKQSTADLENLLQELVTQSPNIRGATQILRILIRDRNVRPEVRHYRALILANTDARYGSPENVRNLLKEMETNGIPADSGTLHAALQAVAVHPDYLLRQEILHTLRDRWLSLSPSGWHHVVAGLVREHQFELALDHIAHMERKDIPVESWLHSLLVYNLCEMEEFDDVLTLMRNRVNQGHEMTLNLWLHVLDLASEALHHELTSYVWTRVVELGYLNPPKGVCSNVLTLASRTGDTEVAASVLRFLEKTGVPFSLEDYEKFVETHLMAGDLYTAFNILCGMHESGTELEQSSTRGILTYMIRTGTQPRDAWAMLKRIKSSGKSVPVGCANVVIELCEHVSAEDVSAVDQAVGFYKELYALCPGGADVATYNSLIQICRNAKETQACMFAIKEMASLEVSPNATTFERLIQMSLDSGNFQSGLMYFRDMAERGFTLNKAVETDIWKRCQQSNDEFASLLRSNLQTDMDRKRRESRTEMMSELAGLIDLDSTEEDASSRTQKPRNASELREQRRRMWKGLREAAGLGLKKPRERHSAVTHRSKERTQRPSRGGSLTDMDEWETNEELTQK
ncbi:pentatricopeptide repeat protein [Paecilomyces variotii No. 5]|uniref:Pentatricopeptide repeat protein n=1 Tax=Byssochlamys spectabilis (strain No. 5 / NBRC 109023) TaxID=1356009 RepID=V5FXQ7_BYSSN|nr:pentatricopeptide repeat protein [Paecilomyces variotii No. 5]